MNLKQDKIAELFQELLHIKGGYHYMGCCSSQICFPLQRGGELRFSISDEDPEDTLGIDLYGGELPGGITGPCVSTG